MKVTRSGSDIPTSGPEEAKAPQTAESPKFVDKLEQTSGPTQTQDAAPTARPSTPGKLTGDIAAALARKEITPDAAVDRVVSRILEKQVGPGAKPEVQAKVETALRDALETDPVLMAKVKSLAD
jgi:hypothetical protein